MARAVTRLFVPFRHIGEARGLGSLRTPILEMGTGLGETTQSG